MFLELLDCEFDESVFYLSARVWLEFVYKHCLRVFLALLEILVKSRNGLSVLDLEILEFSVRMLLDRLAFHIAVVVYDEFSVGCHIHVEFASPEACLLCASERRYRVLCISCFFAVPESTVCYDAGLASCRCNGREYQEGCHTGGQNDQCLFHNLVYVLLLTNIIF